MTDPVDLNPVRTLRLQHDPPFTSPDKFADAAKVARNTVRGVEDGTKNPTGETLHKIADALGVNAWDLANRIDAARLEAARLRGPEAKQGTAA